MSMISPTPPSWAYVEVCASFAKIQHPTSGSFVTVLFKVMRNNVMSRVSWEIAKKLPGNGSFELSIVQIPICDWQRGSLH